MVPLTSYIRQILLPLPLLPLSRFTFSKSQFILPPFHFSDFVPRLETFPLREFISYRCPLLFVFFLLPSSSRVNCAPTAHRSSFTANGPPPRDHQRETVDPVATYDYSARISGADQPTSFSSVTALRRQNLEFPAT